MRGVLISIVILKRITKYRNIFILNVGLHPLSRVIYFLILYRLVFNSTVININICSNTDIIYFLNRYFPLNE